MGLEIKFNRAAAIAAGMEYAVNPRSTPQRIAKAIDEGHEPDFIEWLMGNERIFRVPGMEHWVIDYGDQDPFEDNFIRAHLNGMVYGPLTTWLKAKGITWNEF